MERCYQVAARLEETWSTATIESLRAAMPPVLQPASYSDGKTPQ
jgi:hypothetical protein